MIESSCRLLTLVWLLLSASLVTGNTIYNDSACLGKHESRVAKTAKWSKYNLPNNYNPSFFGYFGDQLFLFGTNRSIKLAFHNGIITDISVPQIQSIGDPEKRQFGDWIYPKPICIKNKFVFYGGLISHKRPVSCPGSDVCSGGYEPISFGVVYDPTTSKWTKMNLLGAPPAPEHVSDIGTSTDGNSLFVFVKNKAVIEVFRFDLVKKSWIQGPSFQGTGVNATYVQDRFVIPGSGLYDPSAGKWHHLPDSPKKVGAWVVHEFPFAERYWYIYSDNEMYSLDINRNQWSKSLNLIANPDNWEKIDFVATGSHEAFFWGYHWNQTKGHRYRAQRIRLEKSLAISKVMAPDQFSLPNSKNFYAGEMRGLHLGDKLAIFSQLYTKVGPGVVNPQKDLTSARALYILQ